MNDVRAITYGEWAFGAGKGVDCMLCLAIGTGIGGGVVINNQLVLNQGGTAGRAWPHHRRFPRTQVRLRQLRLRGNFRVRSGYRGDGV